MWILSLKNNKVDSISSKTLGPCALKISIMLICAAKVSPPATFPTPNVKSLLAYRITYSHQRKEHFHTKS